MKRQDIKVEYIESQFYPDLAVWFNNEVKRKYLELNAQLIAGTGQVAGGTSTPAPVATPTTSTTSSGSAPTQNVPPGTTAGAAGTPPGGMGMPSMGMPSSPGGGGAPASQADVSGVSVDGPKGPGWVIEIKGHHFFNDPSNRRTAGPAHVRNTLLRNLEQGSTDLPGGPGQPPQTFTNKELGIGFAILAFDPKLRDVKIPNPNYVSVAPANGENAFGGPTEFGAPKPAKADPKANLDNPESFEVQRYDFIVQFCWQEKPLKIRQELKKLKEIEARTAAEQAASNPTAPANSTSPAAAPPAAVTPAPSVPAVPPAAASPMPTPAEASPPAAAPPVVPAAPMPPAATAPPAPAPGVPAPTPVDAAAAGAVPPSAPPPATLPPAAPAAAPNTP
jgi:type IV pilus assembly protein PilM